jgi:hypothetical protein
LARGPHCGLTFAPTLRVGGGPKKKKKKKGEKNTNIFQQLIQQQIVLLHPNRIQVTMISLAQFGKTNKQIILLKKCHRFLEKKK